MLSLSADKNATDVDLTMINGQSDTGGGVEHADALIKFAEALAGQDADCLAEARAILLRDAGSEVLVDVAAVAGNFQRMVRIADATGIPLDEHAVAMSGNVRNELELGRFQTAKNTPLPNE